MAAVITQANVGVFHDDSSGTGGCRVTFTIDISGDSVSCSYDHDEIGLTAQQKATIDNILTAIKDRAIQKLKADMAAVTVG